MTTPKEIIRECLGNASWNPNYPWTRVKQMISDAIKADPTVVDVFHYDNSGYNSLALTLFNYDDVEFARFLLRSNANPNIELKGVHSNKLIFFAKSVEALQLLRQYGADFSQFNQGGGFSSEMNLLHSSLDYNQDDSIFDYLINEGFDPHVKTLRGANLWHTLIWYSTYCSPERLFARAHKIKKLGVNLTDRNTEDHYWNLTPLEYLEEKISEETDKSKYIQLREIMTS